MTSRNFYFKDRRKYGIHKTRLNVKRTHMDIRIKWFGSVGIMWNWLQGNGSRHSWSCEVHHFGPALVLVSAAFSHAIFLWCTASHLELTLGFLPQCQEPISLYKPCVKKLTAFRVIAQKRKDHSQQINSLAFHPSGGKHWKSLCSSFRMKILEKLNAVAHHTDLKNTWFYGLPSCLSLCSLTSAY